MIPEEFSGAAIESSTSLTGRKIFLRPFQEADSARLYEAVNQSREMLKRRLNWVSEAHSQQDCLQFVQRASQEKTQGLAEHFGVFDRRAQELIGAGALTRLTTRNASRARLGVWIRADRQNHGYGAEVAKVLCEYGFRDLGLHRIYARMDPANRPYRKVLMKVGFRYEGSLRDEKKLNGRWIHQECWGLLRTEWKK
ncbi:MAG: GNAT family N-acetyltransferase [Elusimicrobia bacterium]|nr:GNAT family N-acetyltransferase [Elusimicrobiota bacterium]